ncbi:MAG: hypothetical protein ACXABY_26530 [Candidatus Thorarchaeota archaeon]|jgi:hypothetical protein
MKVRVNTPSGWKILDLTKPADIEEFGGQKAVDRHLNEFRINTEMRKLAISNLKDRGELPQDYKE